MATCTDCLENCDPIVTDRCTKYTGPDIEALKICKGNSLYEVEAIILQKLQDISEGAGITLATLTSACSFITEQLLSYIQPLTLQTFAQLVFNAFCNLDVRIEEIAALNPSFSFDTACLPGDVSTKDKIIQALITLSCNISTRVTTLEIQTVKQTDLCSQINACLAGVSVQYNSRMVPGIVYPYLGSVSNFDNTGKGLSSALFDKVYLCNGLNGTVDMRGRSPIGAIQSVPGATLDANVDPTLPANLGYNYSQGNKYGVSSVILTSSQTPAHTHTVTDTGHTHDVDGISGGDNNDNSNNVRFAGGDKNQGETNFYFTSVGAAKNKTTGISLGSSGGSGAHTNVQPVTAVLYIIYIP